MNDETPKTGHAAPRTESEFTDAAGNPGELGDAKLPMPEEKSFVRLPETIRAIEFRPAIPRMQEALSELNVRARVMPDPKTREDVYEVANELHDSWIKLSPGDMIRVDKAPDDVYPIDRATFEDTYVEVDSERGAAIRATIEEQP